MKKLIALFTGALFLVAQAIAAGYMYVKPFALNVRSAPSNDSQVISVVHQGDRVLVIEDEQYGWKKIQTPDGEQGYVYGTFLEQDSTKVDKLPPTPKVEGSRYKVSTFRANVRDKSLENIVAVLSKGDIMVATSQDLYLGAWIPVKIISAKNDKYEGRTGYIYKGIVEVVPGYSQLPIILEDEEDDDDDENSNDENNKQNGDNQSGDDESMEDGTIPADEEFGLESLFEGMENENPADDDDDDTDDDLEDLDIDDIFGDLLSE